MSIDLFNIILLLISIVFSFVLMQCVVYFNVWWYSKLYNTFKYKIIEYSNNKLKKIIVDNWNQLIKRDIVYFNIFQSIMELIDLLVILFIVVFPIVFVNITNEFNSYKTIIYISSSLFLLAYLITNSFVIYKWVKTIKQYKIKPSLKLELENDYINNSQEANKNLDSISSNIYIINRAIKYANIYNKKFKNKTLNKKKCYWHLNFMLWRYFYLVSRSNNDNKVNKILIPTALWLANLDNCQFQHNDLPIRKVDVFNCFNNEIIKIYEDKIK